LEKGGVKKHLELSLKRLQEVDGGVRETSLQVYTPGGYCLGLGQEGLGKFLDMVPSNGLKKSMYTRRISFMGADCQIVNVHKKKKKKSAGLNIVGRHQEKG